MKAHAALVALCLAAAPVLAEPSATPTPTPYRLSGGFGRTPASPGEPTPKRGQSLADAVRAASDTRQSKETPKSGVSITNRTLVTDPNRGRLTTFQPASRPASRPSPVPAAATSPARGGAAVETPTPETPAASGEAAEEARWRETARRLRERVSDGKDRVARLDAETKKLENDFYAWDDGQYRDNVIKPAWDKKREELETARRDLEEAERDLADLPEKARKAGALPGWIRE